MRGARRTWAVRRSAARAGQRRRWAFFSGLLRSDGRGPPGGSTEKGPALAGVMEIVEDFDRSTYRAIYTTKLGDVVYVLCAFQKKSTHGIRTPQHLVAVIVERLKQARALHAARQEEP